MRRERGMKRTFFASRRRRAVWLSAVGAMVVAGVAMGAIVATASPTYIDLTTTGGSGTANGALFIQGTGPAGTGQFDPFLTISTNADTEQGHNTCPPEMDAKCVGNGRTHALLAAAVPAK